MSLNLITSTESDHRSINTSLRLITKVTLEDIMQKTFQENMLRTQRMMHLERLSGSRKIQSKGDEESEAGISSSMTEVRRAILDYENRRVRLPPPPLSLSFAFCFQSSSSRFQNDALYMCVCTVLLSLLHSVFNHSYFNSIMMLCTGCE